MGIKRVTMKDVAEKVGVSIVTVSKALAGREGVSVSLREKIITMAREMGYVPRKKRNMGNSLTLNVAIVISERFLDNNSYYFKIYQKMLMQLSERGYIGILEIIPRTAEEVGELPNVIRLTGINQIIVIGEMKTLFLDMLVHTNMRVIFFDFQNEKFDVDCIVSDSENSGFLLTRHLVKCGYRRIGFAGNCLYSRKRQECFLGYIKYMMRKGQIINDKWWINDRDAAGKRIFLDFPEDMPEAFVCCSDEVARRLIDALRQKGYTVPEDIAVVSCGNNGEYVLQHIGFTSYEPDIEEMISQCIHIVEQYAIGKEYRKGISIVKGQIVMRNSVVMNHGITYNFD